eukprot:296646-Amphidinium_carterae.1
MTFLQPQVQAVTTVQEVPAIAVALAYLAVLVAEAAGRAAAAVPALHAPCACPPYQGSIPEAQAAAGVRGALPLENVAPAPRVARLPLLAEAAALLPATAGFAAGLGVAALVVDA